MDFQQSGLAALARDGQAFADLFGMLPDGVVITRQDGTIIFSNTQCEEMFGYASESLMGQGIDVLIPDRFRARHAGLRDAYVTQPENRPMGSRGSLAAIRNDGTEFFVDVMLKPITAAGETFVLAVVRDVTLRVEQQRAHEAQLTAIIERQLEALHTLSTPILQVWDGILAVPIMGTIDARRAAQLSADLLAEVRARQARQVIVDLTAVEAVDSATIAHLMQMTKGVSLLGSAGVISGISPQTAGAMVALGIDLDRTRTFATLKDALRHVLQPTSARS